MTLGGQQEISSEPIAGPSSIPLYLINGVATIWDAQTAATLHCQYDISGLRAGTLPGVAQQNGFLGLPMTLMQEETAYLVEQGIAHLIPVQSAAVVPPDHVVRHQRQERIRRIEKMEREGAEAAQRAAEEGKRKFAQGGDKAKQKREERARAKAAAKRAAGAEAEAEGSSSFNFSPDAGGGGAVAGGSEETAVGAVTKPTAPVPTSSTTATSTNPSPSSPSQFSEETPTATAAAGTAQATVGTGSGHFHTVPSHPSSPNLALSTPITHLPHPLFPVPSTPRHRALVRTFTDLQSKGYRMGLGPRFGGEYLIYPGDYLRYHAHFTSQVIVDDEAVKPTELVAWGRLGTGTKKAGLLCCVDGGDDERAGEGAGAEGVGRKEGRVEYYSLEWANFG